ncbi:MAG: TldD protein, partial [Cognaticolwellia sp.]
MLPQLLFLLLPSLSAQQAPQAPGPIARPAGAPEPAPMLQVAQDAVDHTMTALGERDEPPYHLAIGVTQTHSLRLSASNGAIMSRNEDWNSYADLDLRVGSYALDNTHKLLDAGWFSEEGRSVVRLPIGDGADDMQAAELTLWRELDDSYQQAVRRMTKVRANQAVKVERDDPSNDFSPAPKVVDIRAVQDVELSVAWENSLREVSSVFLEYPEVLQSGVEVTAEAETFLLANSEGTQVQHTRVRYRASVYAVSVAEDGAQLAVYDYLDASTQDGLPSSEILSEMARVAAQRVTDLKSAPLLEPYTGPAILRGRAAGVFFHEIFGHRVEGHRQKDEDEGQTFTDMVGEQVLPEFLSVVDDPTIRTLAGL